jgi:hypothetical protein
MPEPSIFKYNNINWIHLYYVETGNCHTLCNLPHWKLPHSIKLEHHLSWKII